MTKFYFYKINSNLRVILFLLLCLFLFGITTFALTCPFSIIFCHKLLKRSIQVRFNLNKRSFTSSGWDSFDLKIATSTTNLSITGEVTFTCYAIRMDSIIFFTA